MKKNFFAVAAAFSIVFVGLIESAKAEVLLLVDLSVTNEITISAADGLSAATISGSDTTGIYLDDFFSDSSIGGFTLHGGGDLSSSLNASDGSAILHRWSSDTEDGVNIFDLSADADLGFADDIQAFAGSMTWTVSAAIYASALAGAFSGSIFFPADYSGSLAGATILGEWARIDAQAVPLPAALWLFAAGLGGLGFAKRIKRNGLG